ARPHALAQEIRIERRERNDHDGGEDCEIRPKARDGDRAGCCEHCGGRGDHEKGCLEVSREWHRLTYHFRRSEVVTHMAILTDTTSPSVRSIRPKPSIRADSVPPGCVGGNCGHVERSHISDSAIRKYRLNVRFARKRTWLNDYECTPYTVFSGQRHRSLIRHFSHNGRRATQV